MSTQRLFNQHQAGLLIDDDGRWGIYITLIASSAESVVVCVGVSELEKLRSADIIQLHKTFT